MFQKIAIVVNQSKDGAIEFAKSFAESIKHYVLKSTIFSNYPITDSIFNDHDLCVTVGGDGTLLGIVPLAIKYNIPIFTINHGSLGFLSITSTQSAVQSFIDIQNNNFKISERIVLETIIGDEKIISLNETVIRNKTCSRIIKLDVFCDNIYMTKYAADGLIIATTTGSTAYNLSAGGPIVDPKVSILMLTPICPHVGHSKTIILPAETTISIRNQNCEFAIYCDSNQSGYDSEVTMRVGKAKLKLITSQEYSFFKALHEKLGL